MNWDHELRIDKVPDKFAVKFMERFAGLGKAGGSILTFLPFRAQVAFDKHAQ